MARCSRGSRSLRGLQGMLALLLVALAAGFGLPAAGATALTALTHSAAQRSAAQSLTLYSVAEQEQYVNNADDRTRADGNNPFGNYKDVTPVANRSGNGPFPGDEALFSFNLYADSGLKHRAGSAIFTCQYNFNKNAYCDASFRLNNGSTLVAAGSFNFNASKFTLTVTGSFGKLQNKKGFVNETPAQNHSQRLSFTFA